MNNPETSLGRRNFIKLALVGGAVAAGAKALPKPARSGAEGSSPYRWGMVIDIEKCIGCGYCTMACKASNDVSPEIYWNKLFELDEIQGEKRYMTVPCQHCENAPCVDACPVKATYHRADGIVMMDYDRCIGCRYCEVACPYGARSFNWKEYVGENSLVPMWGTPDVERRPRGVVEKCSFCYQKIDRGLENGLMPGVDPEATPACVSVCPTGARVFGDLNDPTSPVSILLEKNHVTRLRDDLGTEPRVYYIHAHFNSENQEDITTEVCE
ncbi:MAG: 4Fe-4S dicluster domain-containing protein [Anaerolineales bacterium]|nr:4Fe-4S dicluster domain-containing protein [Anaerolineales bacterium]